VPARRPEEQLREDPGAGRQGPALETVGNRGGRRHDRHRQDVEEERCGAGGGDVAADHAGEERDEADHCHRARREPSVPRAERAERDECGSDEGQREKCRQPGSPGAFELDEHQHRERPEGREQRHLGLLDHLVGEREDGRHHDRRARRVLERRHVHGKRSYDGPERGAWHVGRVALRYLHARGRDRDPRGDHPRAAARGRAGRPRVRAARAGPDRPDRRRARTARAAGEAADRPLADVADRHRRGPARRGV
jgi:hypothetical protein